MMTRGFVMILAAALCVLWFTQTMAAPRLHRGGIFAAGQRQPQAQKRPPARTPNGYRRDRGDHDRTLRDYREGRIRPFAEIRRRVQRTVGGRILDARLDRRNSPWIYRLRVLTDDGQVLAVRLNAQTGRILDVKGKRK